MRVAFDVIVKQGERELPLRLPLGLDKMGKRMDEWKMLAAVPFRWREERRWRVG